MAKSYAWWVQAKHGVKEKGVRRVNKTVRKDNFLCIGVSQDFDAQLVMNEK